ncbi:hypothetical protein ACJZ2D_006122 [Fusarium nematophilum]
MKLQYLITFFILGVDASDVFPSCKDCVPLSVYTAPGLGFGLSFSSGTAAAHLHNGTVLDLALVRATPESINKKLGRPATPDVGTLAEMFASLRDAATTALAPSSPLDRVAVTTPPMPGLADYDLVDALEYAKLTEAHAVMAAHGLGLCENYDNMDLCTEEELLMPLEKVMVVGLTEMDLRAEVMKAQGPFSMFSDVIDRFVYLEAGLNARDGFQSEEAFWAYAGSRLKMLVSRLPMKLTRVWLVGENSTHPAFLGALREAMEGSGHGYVFGGVRDEQVLVRGEAISPTFSSARSAVQYARWRQQAPLGCYESRVLTEILETEKTHPKIVIPRDLVPARDDYQINVIEFNGTDMCMPDKGVAKSSLFSSRGHPSRIGPRGKRQMGASNLSPTSPALATPAFASVASGSRMRTAT